MKKTKNIKVEWCENFIKSTFGKIPKFAKGIETNCFFEMAEKSGLYIKGTYGSSMSKALENIAEVKIVQDDNGNYMYSTFYMK
ncbi:hypothetical protein C8E03_108158 [Lachnotalea glycerini]|uniref:Uncharacterized protein n=1 Tax=Lachnotalea glycerini TaxID=1763509 RepID=A0A318EK20_9FIRM|nr:hypothetical protein [Lachnotalea glycerini]PXV88431.1 hypothetical protein C8E03_108158 [Lachnotalea glycerini]